jgi:hypothetical protein
MTEVGVSLALRQQEKLLKSSREGRMKPRESLQPSKKKVLENEKEKKSRFSSLEVLIEGASIYAMCLFVPSILGKLVSWYQASWDTNGIFHQLALQACSSSWLSGLQWCIRNTRPSSSMSVLAPDAGISDVAIVVTLCVFMAVIRLTLVHFLVPNYNQPRRLAALVRCKSIHLLSASYEGTVTPVNNLKRKTVNLDEAAMMLSIPALSNTMAAAPDVDAEETLDPKQLFGKASSSNSADLLSNEGPREVENSEENDYDLGMGLDEDYKEQIQGISDDEDDLATAPAVSAGLMSSSSALSLQALLHQAAPMAPEPGRESMSRRRAEEPPERIFAAPKYATACFRMLYCSASCIIALLYFNDADFWPPAVGGHGSTKNCWDLSSVGAAVMDSDFDHHNTVLRRYYLVQLSYHFHSGAFHVLAALLLWFVSSSKNPGRAQPKHFGIFPSGVWTMNNMQSLFQHLFAVGVMTFSYLFSSLRRLGVIAMFSFDLSSWFLHLLQMSINVPAGRRRISPFWIKILYRVFVIPAFCYSRFYIFPFVIFYSALEESHDWLRQLENMLLPGTARYIHGIFVVSFLFLMAINVVYARRLFYHAHVKETVNPPNR